MYLLYLWQILRLISFFIKCLLEGFAAREGQAPRRGGGGGVTPL